MRRAVIGGVVVLALALGACGDDDGGGGGAAATDEPSVAVPDDVPGVLAEVAGLDREARRARLVELVRAEGGEVTFYTSMSADNAEAVVSAFEEAFDVDVELFRADSEGVAQRIAEETSAGVQGADLVEASALLMESLDPDAFVPYDSPYLDDLIDGVEHGHWVADQLDLFVLSWNSDAVAGEEVPDQWQDLADPRFAGRLAMEVDDVEWFVGLLQHLQASGMTEAEAQGVLEAMAGNARFVKGHSLMAQLLASGEFDVAASNYMNRIRFLQGEGAPVAFEPIVEPIIATPSGLGLLEDAAHPAAAVLFADWLVSDAQDVFVEVDIAPARADLQVGSDVELVIPDVSELSREFDRWVARYEQLVGGADVIDDEG